MVPASMKPADGLRGDAMQAAFREAVAGKPMRLYAQLSINSGLPGTRANIPLAQGFATDCVAVGKPADKLIFAMCLLDAEEAPGDTGHEFLPVCGALALGARAAADPALRPKALTFLHELSEDFRFRVREAVPLALAKLGAQMGDVLVHDFVKWTDGFFQGSAALDAMADPAFLATIHDADAAVARLGESYRLAKNASRSASRYPGFKALVDTLSRVPATLATRFGMPVFDELVVWSNTEMKELRGAVESFIKSKKLEGRWAPEVKRVRAALDASVPPPRDPTLAVKGMRGRGKKRDRR
ncbi:MAG: hypothetical protein JWP97_5530 [Labilithrix sp.]|nr:hypothetical protein [Labilithrix sp.]